MDQRIRILQVEDSERDAELILRAVRAAGYGIESLRVDTAEAMARALAMSRWDVILADFNMPRFDGFHALDVLHRHGEDIPLLIVSGTIGEELAVDLMHAGAADYIMKDNLARLGPALTRELTEAEHRRARREAERRLRERERMLSTAQRIANLGTWEYDYADDSLRWSEVLLTIMGRPPDYNPTAIDALNEAVHPDDRERVDTQVRAAVREGRTQELEYRYVRPDGAVRWVYAWVEPEMDERGQAQCLTATVLDITDRKEMENALRASELDYRTLLEQAADGIVVADPEGRITTVNTRAAAMLGYPLDEILERSLFDFLDPDELRERPFRSEQLKTGQTLTNERNLLRRDGSYVPTETSSKQLDDGRIQVIVRDITARKRAEEALRQSEREYRNLFERASDAIIIYDRDSEAILDVNRSGLSLYGIPKSAFVGRSLRDLLGSGPLDELQDGIRAADDGMQQIEAVRHRPDNSRVNLVISASLIEFQGRPAVLSIQRDVTTQKELERQLAHQAFHDALTGMANRALFQDRLDHALTRVRASREDVAVLVLDLDRFKLINESLGHEVGDHLLLGVAERLAVTVREGDTVARLGGDEFAILLEHGVDMREVMQISERINSAIQQPFVLDGHDIVVTSSIGIVIAEEGAGTSEDLLRNADVALYRAKDSGPGRFVVFDPSMNATMLERLRLETDLRQAIQRGELRVFFQPTVELATGQVVGLEALVRWRHPARGTVSPAAFIPLAEEAGLIRMIDQWVLDSACRQLARWQAVHGRSGVLLNVNLSAQGFQHPEIVQDVARVLRTTGVAPHQLQLELTESVIMRDVAATNARLSELKDLGVRLAIDDFGTGYSSLSYLKRFPVDTLKVDKTFIDGLGTDAEDTAIVEATVSLARALGLIVVAEGVETRDAAEQLRALGCELAQGYLFAAPLPPEELDALWARDLEITSSWRVPQVC